MTSKNLKTRLAVVGLCLILAGCSQRSTSRTNSFLLRDREADLRDLSAQVVEAIASSLRSDGGLESGYPQVGRLATEPDPSQANVQQLHCRESEPQDAHDGEACILLNRAGDFIRVQPITWQSEAFFMYRIYVAPRLIFTRVDMTKDFVAIDMVLMSDPGRWEAVDHAIRQAADTIGARPFRP